MLNFPWFALDLLNSELNLLGLEVFILMNSLSRSQDILFISSNMR